MWLIILQQTSNEGWIERISLKTQITFTESGKRGSEAPVSASGTVSGGHEAFPTAN